MKVIISPNIRLRVPEAFDLGVGSIVDDYCYFSVRVRVGAYSHIASGCSVAGGKDKLFEMGRYSSLSSGVKVWCASNDFVNDLVMIEVEGLELPNKKMVEGDVILGDFTGIGSNSVVMPGSVIPIGSVVGAQSFVPAYSKLEPWTVYAGNPVRKIKERNRSNVLNQVAYLDSHLSYNNS
ncbi:MAG: hypothetical protein AAGA64_00245 [Bacteroidota bacterium]